MVYQIAVLQGAVSFPSEVQFLMQKNESQPLHSADVMARLCWLVFQLTHWHRFGESYTLWHITFWILSYVTVWFQFCKSCSGCQLLIGPSSSCVCWSTSRLSDTCHNVSQTCWYQLLKYEVDLHYALRRVATLSFCRHDDKLAAELSLLLHCKHGAGCWQIWNCCIRQTRFIVNWNNFCLILFMNTRIKTDSMMPTLSLPVWGTLQMPQLLLLTVR